MVILAGYTSQIYFIPVGSAFKCCHLFSIYPSRIKHFTLFCVVQNDDNIQSVKLYINYFRGSEAFVQWAKRNAFSHQNS